MRYEVEITVKAIGHNTETSRTLKETWSFGDNPRWTLAGAAYVVEETADHLSDMITDEIKGSDISLLLNVDSGKPRRVL